METNFKVGDIVSVPTRLAHLSHPETIKDQIGEVVAFYPNFFNVKYKEGYQQSIKYTDANIIQVLKL